MAELLEYDFRVVGAANVEKALSSMEHRFAQHNAKMNTMLGGRQSAGARAGGSGTVGAGVVREQTAALRKVEREQIASNRRIERERLSTEKSVAREQQKTQRYWETAQSKSRDRQMSVAREVAAARSEFVKSTVGRGFGRVAGAARAVGTAGLAMTGVGGAALAATAVSQAMDLDERSRRVIINGRAAGQAAAYDPDQLRKQVSGTAVSTGVKPEDVMSGIERYVSLTGDIKGAVSQSGTFAKASQATGANVGDISSTAVVLKEKFGLKSPEEVQQGLASLIYQGKQGAFELKDIAQFAPELAGKAQMLGLSGLGGLKTMGGLSQIAMSQVHNAPEAATDVKDMLNQLTVKASKLQSGEALGGKAVKVFEGGDATKPMRDVREVLADVISKSHGNVEQLSKVFDIRGTNAAAPLISAYRDAAGSTKGTPVQKEAAGRSAILKTIEDASNVTGKWSDVEQDSVDAMKSVNIQLEIFSTQLKEAVASELFPLVTKLAPELVGLIPAVVQLTKGVVSAASFFAEHPFAGLGAAVTASIVYEIASAKLGSIIAGAVAQSMMAGVAAQAAAGGGAAGLLAGGRAALNGGGLVGTLGAAAGAAVGVYAAVSSEQDLATVTGGQKGVWEGVKSTFTDGSFFKGTDDYQNAQATEERRKLDAADGSGSTTNAASAKASADQTAAATALKDAAAALKAALPAAKPNTGNSPSPVKG